MTAAFAAAWLEGDPRAAAFLPLAFRHAPAREEAVAQAATRALPGGLWDALAEQNPAVSPQVELQLQRLREPGTTVVVTGQQVGLFLGPLYTLYKAATAIKVAAALEAETGRRCVPLFWLQTEDHDLAEANAATVALPSGESRRLSIRQAGVPVDGAAARIPIKHLRLGAGISDVLRHVDELLQGLPNHAPVMALLRRAYREGATWPEAFSAMLRALCADHGLLVLDPRTPGLARLAAPVHRRALLEAGPVAELLAQRAAAMTAAGFAPQVHVRSGSPLCFFSPDGVDGPRYRLEPGPAERWTLVAADRKRSVSTRDLLTALDQEPARFSTSALLRPVLQDTWLPTAAYVGGPGELAYLAQLGPLYEHLRVRLPLAVPRARFRILDPRTRANLDALGITADEACGPREGLLHRLARRQVEGGLEDPARLGQRLREAVDRPLQDLEAGMGRLDPTLQKELATTRASVLRSVDKLTRRYARVLALRDGVALARLERVRAWLLPDGQPQERVHGVLYAAARFGIPDLVNLVISRAPAFDGGLRDLSP